MPTSKRPERLVVDANPILAALLGGMARRIFFETDIQEFAVPEVTNTEVRGYLPQVALKIGVETAILEFALDLLPLSPYSARTYRQSIAEANRRIGKRDPKDVDVPPSPSIWGCPSGQTIGTSKRRESNISPPPASSACSSDPLRAENQSPGTGHRPCAAENKSG